MTQRSTVLIVFSGILAVAQVGIAQGPTAQPPESGLAAKAELEDRLFLQSVSPVDVGRPLATDADRLQRAGVFEHRLRAGGTLDWHESKGFVRQLGLTVQADVFSGAMWRNGDDPLLRYDPLAARSADPLDADHHLLRQFAATATTSIGRISVGRMVSSWGLGLLAQDGAHDPFQFGIKRDGSVVDRISLATMPAAWFADPATAFPLFAIIAVDRVVVDDLADLAANEDANNLVAALLYKSKTSALGMYGVLRSQQDDRGLTIDATVLDLFAAHGTRMGRWQVQAATEWLMITGETTYFRTPTNPEELKLLQYGGAVHIEAARPGFASRLQAGLASGDDRPFDDTVRNLKFASDYRIGMVMFGAGIRRMTAVGATNISDPRFTGNPPLGFERLATNGALSQAIYLNPVVRFEPLADLQLVGGLLWARAPLPLVDPYQTGLAGGAPRNQRGGKAATDLGLEVDAGLRWKKPLGAGLALHVRFDAGLWQPGDAFDDLDGRPAAAVAVIASQILLNGEW